MAQILADADVSTELETPSIPRYRNILKGEVPEEFLKPDNLHLLWLAGHLLVIAGCYWLMATHFSWWHAPVVALVVGHSFACMGFVSHEVSHGGAIKNRHLRHLLSGIAFSPFGIGAHLWSRWHNAEHHGHTQHPDLDPDRLFKLSEYQHNPVLKFLYRRSPILRNLVIFGFFTMMMTQHNITMIITYLRDPETSKRDRAIIVAQFLGAKLFWVGVTFAMGWPVLLMGYLIPLLVANSIVIGYISTNHFLNPLADESDVLASSLSVTLPKWLGWLDVMHLRFGAHVAHHLFPTAPSRFSRKVDQRIAELWPDRFHRMPIGQAFKLLWNTPWVYSEDGESLLDPGKNKQYPTLGNGL